MFETEVVEFDLDAALAAVDPRPPTPEDEAFIAMLNAADLDGTVGTLLERLAAERVTPAELADSDTGVSLAWLLAGADPAILDDYALVELVTAWSRLTAWTQAGAARAAAELARRESMAVPEARPLPPRAHRRRASLSSAAAHEIAMRMVITRSQAQTLIDVGLGITGPLTEVGSALAEGLIDLPRARAFTEGLSHAPLPVALDVQDAILPTAPHRTVRQVVDDIQRALVSVDPEEASQRHRAARERRRVGRPSPLPDGMAGVWAVLPAPDAVALDIALDAAARTAKNGGDGRSIDQLRADAMAHVAWDALETGWLGSSAPDSPGPATTGPCPSTAERTAGGPASSGPDLEPGTGDTSDAAHGRRGRWRLGQVGGRPAQVRVTVPLGILLPGGATGGGPEVGASGMRAPNGGAPSASAQTGGEQGESNLDPGGPVPVAELDGYGAVPPDVARALALGGTWSRLITDPVSGLVRDVGRTRYHPPTGLADLVRTRDRTCVRPGCGAAARGCDLDHTVPYHLGGTTSEWNLGALCPSDHAFKTAGAFAVRQVEPGVFEFDLPSGHRYRRLPDGSSRLVPCTKPAVRTHRGPGAQASSMPSATACGHDPGPPPF